MKNTSFLLFSALLLSSCADYAFPGMKGNLDGKSYLSGLEGPKVQGVNSTLESAAIEQEKAGDYNGAAQMYKQLLDKESDNEIYAYKLAENLRRIGELDTALELYTKLVKNKADNYDALEGKGLTLLAKGDIDNAGTIFAEIQKKSPNRWRTLNAIGILFISQNMPQEGKYYFDKALEQKPDSASLLNNVGLAQAVQRDYPNAINTLKKAVSQTPNGTSIHKSVELNLALVYGASGQLTEAESIAKQYFTGAALKNNMGLYAHMAQDDSLAQTYFNMALSESKTYYERAWKNLDAVTAGNQPKAKGSEKRISIAEGGKKDVGHVASWMNDLKPSGSALSENIIAPMKEEATQAAPVSPVIAEPVKKEKHIKVEAKSTESIPPVEIAEPKAAQEPAKESASNNITPKAEPIKQESKPVAQETLATSDSLKPKEERAETPKKVDEKSLAQDKKADKPAEMAPASGNSTEKAETKPSAETQKAAEESSQDGEKPSAKNGFQAFGSWVGGIAKSIKE